MRRDVQAFLAADPADISGNKRRNTRLFLPLQPDTAVTLRGVNKLLQSVRPPLGRWWPSLVAAWAVLPAAAQPLPDGALLRAQAVVAEAARALAPAGARIVVAPGAPDPRLRLAPCEQVQAYLPPGTRPWGASRVGLRCTRGAKLWNIGLPVTVHVLAPAPVAPAALPAGAVIDATGWALAEVDWAAEPSAVQAQAEHLAGRTLARPVAAGQPLRAADLRPRQWFAAGDTVRVVAVGEGFAISGEGQALSAGIEGQAVRVRTENGRIVSGMPLGERRVEVAL